MGEGYAGGMAAAFDANSTYSDVQYSQLVIRSTPPNSVGPTVRASATGASRNFMWLEINSDQFMRFYSVVAGTSTQIGSTFDGGAGYFAVGQTIQLSANGTTYSFFKNGSACCGTSATDSALASGAAGFATAGGSIDDWEGGDDSAPPSTKPGLLLRGVAAFFVPPYEARP